MFFLNKQASSLHSSTSIPQYSVEDVSNNWTILTDVGQTTLTIRST